MINLIISALEVTPAAYLRLGTVNGNIIFIF
jgi:hypothetical protein